MPHKALIIGGGISGLSAAYYLSKAGIRPTVLERQPRVGGVIQTTVQQGCLLEEGPDGFMAAKPWAMNLILLAPTWGMLGALLLAAFPTRTGAVNAPSENP